MTDIIIPLIVGLGGVLATVAFNWGRLAFERRTRRRTLTAALISEASNTGISLMRTLLRHPRSENLASLTDQFYAAVAAHRTSGDVFLAHLPSADVVPPGIIKKLADTYTDLRAAAVEAARHTEVGSFRTPMGVTWALKDRLANTIGELREAVLLLEDSN